MRASRRSLALALAAVAVVAILAMSGGGVLAALPVLLLCGTLAFAGYVGEDKIARLRSSRQQAAHTRAPVSLPCPRLVRVTVPRGSALLSWGRAVRPPPARTFVA